ncbi:hypothetical protein [Cardinium endosymbiont of Sogatella furcifera]|uniref:hypothetical protein n=1 Tax=Cardinium endosymbiont of Sogatella furcifera TaxID=650378 RepID=UPI0013B45C48|nr:hypothetical protein [Cardinium endosymbiont of Sogatella furcifera]
MGRRYINILVLIGITQLMQCVFLSKGLYIDSTEVGQNHLSKICKKDDLAKQGYPNLLCLEFNALFQRGREGLEKVLIKCPKACMNGLHTSDDRYNVTYFIISDGYIKALDYNSRPLDTSYPRIDVDHIDEELLKKMRDSLYEPNSFQALINHYLQRNYKVIMYASIEYPAFISMVLIHGIGFPKEQVDNMCIVFNDYNAIHKQNSFMCAEHIKHAERLIFINHISSNKPVYGLVVSSYNPDAKLIERADCDYAFIRIDPTYQSNHSVPTSRKKFSKYVPKSLRKFLKSKNRCGDSSVVVSYWDKIKQFEETRGELMQKAEHDLNQSLVQSSVKKWRSSIAPDNKNINMEQLGVQSHARTCRSSERIKKAFSSVPPSLKRWRSLTTKNAENLEVQKYRKNNNLNQPLLDLNVLNGKPTVQKMSEEPKLKQHWSPTVQEMRKEHKRMKSREERNSTLWRSFNGPGFLLSFS